MIVIFRRFEVTGTTTGPHASKIKVVAEEVVLEKSASGRVAPQDVEFDPDFPHEINGDLAH